MINFREVNDQLPAIYERHKDHEMRLWKTRPTLQGVTTDYNDFQTMTRAFTVFKETYVEVLAGKLKRLVEGQPEAVPGNLREWGRALFIMPKFPVGGPDVQYRLWADQMAMSMGADGLQTYIVWIGCHRIITTPAGTEFELLLF